MNPRRPVSVKKNITTATRMNRHQPRLPHERDESSDSQTAAKEQDMQIGRQAAADVERGLVDTDRGPVLERIEDEHFPPAPATRPRRR
jgi:hypothetical protein